MDKIGPKAVTNEATTSTSSVGAAESLQTSATELMSKPEPNVCTNESAARPEQAADSPTARMWREQTAARMAENARQTGADGTGQGDGPSMRPDRTPEQVEQDKKDAEDACRNGVSVVGGAVGSATGPFGAPAGALAGGLVGASLCRTPTGGDPGAAGASSANPLERDVRWQIF
jgi:hypothetical protein